MPERCPRLPPATLVTRHMASRVTCAQLATAVQSNLAGWIDPQEKGPKKAVASWATASVRGD